MPTKRRTRSARRTIPVTDAALDAFAELQRLETQCSCPPRDWAPDKYWKHKTCEACERWWDAHHIIWHELKLAVWDWPCVQSPDEQNPYPEGSYAADHWGHDPKAVRRYKILADALKARETNRKGLRHDDSARP